MEEGLFARILELGEASPFTFNCCARHVLSLQKPSCNTEFLIHGRKTREGNADRRICSAAPAVLQQTCSGGLASTTFEKPENGLYLYEPTSIPQREGKRQGSVSVDCGISTH